MDELQQTAVGLEHFLKEQVRLPDHGLAKQIVVVPVQVRFRGRSKDVTQVEPLTGETLGEGMSTRIIDHSLDLGMKGIRRAKLPFRPFPN